MLTAEMIEKQAIQLAMDFVLALLTIVGLKLLFSILRYATKKAFDVKKKIRSISARQEKKDQTIYKTINVVYSYLFGISAIIMTLIIFGVDVVAIVTSAGLIAIVITFAAQDLLNDIVAGFFILLEDYFYVGDFIETGGVSGTVKEIGLRATTIIATTGETHIILNRQLTNITNYTTVEGDFQFDFPLAYSNVNVQEAFEKIKTEINDYLPYEARVVGLFKPTDLSVSVRIHITEKKLDYPTYNQQIREAIVAIANI